MYAIRNKLKTYSLLVILCLTNIIAEACQCSLRPIKQEIESADLIFIGVVTDRNELAGNVSYKFSISTSWKGEQKSVVSIITGFGGGDCGMVFEKNEEYLIFSNGGETSRCRPNEILRQSRNIALVKYHLDSNFKSQLATENSSELNNTEAIYFNSLLMSQRGSFDFKNKKIAYYSNNSRMDKQTYFGRNGGRASAEQLLIFDDQEKQQAGYAGVIVTWRKQGVSKRLKRKILKELADYTAYNMEQEL